jgi:hypothetical protein
MMLVVLSGNGEIAVRLGAALILGSAVGLNRDLHGKPAGVRTHALVSLGAAVAVIISLGLPGQAKSMDANAISRVLQGILTGIGFLGADVILRDPTGHVTGLTTAATNLALRRARRDVRLGLLVRSRNRGWSKCTRAGVRWSDRVSHRTFAQASNRVPQQTVVQN